MKAQAAALVRVGLFLFRRRAWWDLPESGKPSWATQAADTSPESAGSEMKGLALIFRAGEAWTILGRVRQTNAAKERITATLKRVCILFIFFILMLKEPSPGEVRGKWRPGESWDLACA